MTFLFIQPEPEAYPLRVSIWSMQSIRRAALSLGLAYESSPPAEIDPDVDYEGWISWRDPSRCGIPIHKLITNDGWHIGADECREAMLALSRQTLDREALECALRSGRDPGDATPNECVRRFPEQARAAMAACNPLDDFGRWILLVACRADGRGFHVW